MSGTLIDGWEEVESCAGASRCAARAQKSKPASGSQRIIPPLPVSVGAAGTACGDRDGPVHVKLISVPAGRTLA
jgi:hypothetical protein